MIRNLAGARGILLVVLLRDKSNFLVMLIQNVKLLDLSDQALGTAHLVLRQIPASHHLLRGRLSARVEGGCFGPALGVVRAEALSFSGAPMGEERSGVRP